MGEGQTGGGGAGRSYGSRFNFNSARPFVSQYNTGTSNSPGGVNSSESNNAQTAQFEKVKGFNFDLS